MSVRLRHLVCGLAAAALVVTTWTPDAAAQSIQRVNNLLSAWQMDQADEAIDELEKERGDIPEVLYLRARHHFFEGRYEKALATVEEAIDKGGDENHIKRLHALVGATKEVTTDYVKHTSSQGRFELWVPPGKDEVLVPFAGEALERAYDEIGDELGYKPATPIRVEVYPRTSMLAEVSSLTEDEIRTSGTIALCKYNRLMITSPRALLRGYGWVDTLVHEYVHYVINSKTKNRVPIWMHEGLAKYLERRWRGASAQSLSPATQSLLKRRLEADTLITFDQMHPSMAKLPSQEDAAVAFAQVFTVMEYLRGEVGEGAFKKLLDAIDDGADAKSAFSQTIGKPFSRFERDWLAYLKQRDTAEFPDDPEYDDKLVFMEEGGKKESEVDQIDKPEARDHLHLGQMLQARNRHGAALVQYEKAARLLDKTNPLLQTRRAQCLMHADRADEIGAILEPVLETYPSYVQAWIEMGKASLVLGDYEAARDHLTEAARINPFDPEIHQKLSEVYDKLGDTDQADQFRKFAKLVS
jgi:tetratricopeptide (TPR) repeat protein